jgi:hypothetical protein
MIILHPKLLGLGQYILFPILALFIEIVGYIANRPVPVQAIAVLIPISLIQLTIYTPLIANRVSPNPGFSLVQFARGAYYSAVGILSVTLFLLVIAVFVYHQGSVGFGVFFVSLGSLWLPIASAAAGYGKMLASGEDKQGDFLERLKQRHTFENVASMFLMLYLRQFNSLRRDPRAILALPLSIGFYIVGWAVLTTAGGYPFTVFGIVMLFIYLASTGFEARAWVPIEKRKQISDLIANSLPQI